MPPKSKGPRGQLGLPFGQTQKPRVAPPPRTEAWRRWNATGTFIEGFARWHLWVTLTFRFPVPPPQAIGRLRDWLDKLAKQTGDRVVCAFGVEGVTTGTVHIHAVVSFLGPMRVTVTEADALWRKWGHAQVRVFNPSDPGACWYLAKEGAWDVTYGRPSKHWPRLPGPLPSIFPVP